MAHALSDRELAVSRLIEGRRETVFQVFTEVSHLSQWWGPTGFTTTTRTFEFSEGGVWEFTMHAPDGTDYPEWIKWIDIRPPELIVLVHGEGPDDSERFTTTIEFDEKQGGTQVTLRTEFQTKALRDKAVEQFGALEGGEQTLSSLARYVATRKKKPDE